MTLFEADRGRMAIHTMNAKQTWYNDLIQGRGRPNGHPYHHTWYNICKEQSLVQMSTAAELV